MSGSIRRRPHALFVAVVGLSLAGCAAQEDEVSASATGGTGDFTTADALQLENLERTVEILHEKFTSLAAAMPEDRLGWAPMEGDTLVMGVHQPYCSWTSRIYCVLFVAYSVAKAVSSAAMMLLASDGYLDWEESTENIWPELTRRDVLDVQRPVSALPDKGINVAEAVSHRLGLPGTPMPGYASFRNTYRAPRGV